MPDGHNPIRQYLIEVLSHGERRPAEIKTIAEDTRWNERIVANKLRELESSTDLVEKRIDGEAVFYSLTDSTHTESLKPVADPEEVSSLLAQMELQLGLKDRNVLSLPTELQEQTLPEVLAELNSTVQTRKHVFNEDDDLLARFFEIFDSFLEIVAESFRESSDQFTVSFITIPTIHQFFTLVHSLNKEWKSGNVMLKFNQELRNRQDDLLTVLQDVPPDIGIRIHAIGVSMDVKVAREMVKVMVSTGDYPSSQLLRAINKTYISTGKTQKIFKDLGLEGSLSTPNQASEIIQELRKRFRDSDEIHTND